MRDPSPAYWPMSRSGSAMGLLLSLAMDAASLWLLWRAISGQWDVVWPSVGGAYLTGTVGLAFFGATTVRIVTRLVRRGGVWLTEDGVLVRTTMREARLPWPSIGEVRLDDAGSTQTLIIARRPEASAWLSPGHRWRGRLGSHRGPRAVYINATVVPDLVGLRRALAEQLEERSPGPPP